MVKGVESLSFTRMLLTRRYSKLNTRACPVLARIPRVYEDRLEAW